MLKDKIKENHTKAEKSKFMKMMFSGEVDTVLYKNYLQNQLLCYSKLESLCLEKHILDGIESIQRAALIQKDIDELDSSISTQILPATISYLNHLDNLDSQGLLAHLYIRHFGDMYGGQMIKKMVPGSGSMYSFEDKDLLIATLRPLLNDNLADEANAAFTYIINFFEELVQHYEQNI